MKVRYNSEVPVYTKPNFTTKLDQKKEDKQKRIDEILSDGVWAPVFYNGNKTTYMACTDGRIFNTWNAQLIEGSHNPAGYLKVELSYNDGHGRQTVKVGKHRIIAQTFIPNPEGKPEVNHKNKIHDDNRVENLEWVTRSENSAHGSPHNSGTTSRPVLISELPMIFQMAVDMKEIDIDDYAKEYGYNIDMMHRLQEIAFYLEAEGRLQMDGSADMRWTVPTVRGMKCPKYVVSPYGLVAYKRGDVISNIVPLNKSADGYYKINIVMPNGATLKTTISRIVAQTFIPNPENKAQVNHKDGNKLHEWVDNLNWMTPSENCSHRDATGLSSPMRGSANGRSIYTEDQIRKACQMMSVPYQPSEIEKITGVKNIDQYKIKKGDNWTHISKDYVFPEGRFTTNGVWIGDDGKTLYYDKDHRDRTNQLKSKYPDEALHKACKLMQDPNLTIGQVAEMTGIDYNALHGMYYHQRYLHVANQYEFDTSKRKSPKGEKANNAVHTKANIRRACEMLMEYYPPKMIYDETGVDKTTLSDLRNDKTWVSVTKDFTFPKGRYTNHGKWIGEDGTVVQKKNTMEDTQFNVSKHTDDTIRRVCELLASGDYQIDEIMEMTGTSRSTVEGIKSRKLLTRIGDQYDFPRVIFTRSGRIVRWSDGREKIVPLKNVA